MKDFIQVLVQATESAAKASAKVIGCGNQLIADQLAVDAMRKVLSNAPFYGTVVIGEGERDEAPMLYIGEKVGDPSGVEVDIALDPLEGTGICSNLGEGAMSVLACGPKGCFLHAPDVYMQKIAIGKGFPKGIVSLKYTIEGNIRNLANAKGIPVSELIVVILKRSRHDELIRSVRRVGARVKLIADGDIAAILGILLNDDCDIYVGIGGAPEGVLAAVALRACGGQIEGKLIFNSNEQEERARSMGIDDMNKIYSCNELVNSDEASLVITGITDGKILQGVKKDRIQSLIMVKGEVQYLKRYYIRCK